MPIPSFTRRHFLVSSSLLVAAGSVSLGRIGQSARAPGMIVSSERANGLTPRPRVLVLEGPRVERLQVMTESLAQTSGRVVLRLDPVDDQLIDIAAQQAGVRITRDPMGKQGSGTLADVRPQQWSLA